MTAPVGIWLGASNVLGRDVLVDEPYPHIHGHEIAGGFGERVRLRRRDCAACMAAQPSSDAPTGVG